MTSRADTTAEPGMTLHISTDPPPDLRPILDPVPLSVARYPADWRPRAGGGRGGYTGFGSFTGLVVDAAEVTLVAAEEVIAALDPPLAVEPGWRRITFPGPLPWEMVGFLADVAGRLAAARIPFTSMAGFTTDSVLVREAQAELAMAVLRGEPPPAQRPDVTNP